MAHAAATPSVFYLGQILRIHQRSTFTISIVRTVRPGA
jgi:hypothetical protein